MDYWGTPAPAVQNEAQIYQEPIQQVQHEQPIIRELDTFDYTQVQQAPLVATTIATKAGSIHEGGLNPAFLAGFRIAKTMVLERLNDPTPITRQALIDFVNSLQPKQ